MKTEALSTRDNMLWNSAGSFIYLGLQWLITVLVVRLSGNYNAAGELSLAWAIANIFTPFAMFKIRTFQVSDVNNKYSSSEYVGFRLFTISAALIGTIIYSLLTCELSYLNSIIACLAFKAVDVYIDVLHGIDQKNGRMDFIGKSFIIRGILSFVAFCACLIITESVACSLWAMFLVTLPVAFIYDRKKAKRFDRVSPQLSKRLITSLTRTCTSAVLAAFFCTMITTLPRQYLAVTFGDASLGVYSSVATPVLIVQMGATYLYSPLLVPFAEAFSQKDIHRFLQLFARTLLGILIIGAIAFLGFGIAGEWLLVLLFGNSIVEYVYLLQPVLLYTLSTALLWFFSDLLIVMRKTKVNFIGNITGFLLVIPFSYFFINTFGVNGTNIASIIATFVPIIIMLCCIIRAARIELQKP